eukprot:TRINITY_DN3578_c0_g1_i6.p1 TRINITY_DN3578_c0_g1~~TRINITY_DN3578_c0_g1_i6.p1  ORF type:complete len:260 (+),score=41.99 TRINITY_DN3578_c0_g1_i6:104-781(+)
MGCMLGVMMGMMVLYYLYLNSFNHREELVQLLECTDKIFNKHNIPYFLDSGTLLGAIREGGWIPWDGRDDIDIGVFHWNNENISALTNVFKEVYNCGYMLSREDTKNLPSVSSWVIRKGAFRIFYNRIVPYYLDITDYELHKMIVDESTGKEVTVITDKEYAHLGHFFRIDKILPLQRCLFEGKEFNCPQDPVYVLEREYGSDWKTPKRDFTGGDVKADTKVVGW